jgi:hypothetical protein
LVEKGSNFWPFATEMMLEIVSAAGVRLVAVCKTATALRALPQGTLGVVAGSASLRSNTPFNVRGFHIVSGIFTREEHLVLGR